MADQTMKFILDFAAKTAGLKDATELADQLGEELEGSESAGKQMASALKAAADKAERALSDTLDIAEKLGDALGSDMRQSIGQAKIDDMAVKFQQAGLQASDLDGELDSITDSIKRMDAASGSAKGRLGEVGTAMQRVGTETDRSRSVMANFVGNAAQEIPGLTGAFGPLNMAAGQFVEYASEGGIKLGGMVKMAAGVGAVSIAMAAYAKQAKLAAEARAFRKETVDEYVKSLRAGVPVAKAMVDRLTEAGKVEIKIGGVLDEVVGGDVTSAFARAGVTVDQFSNAVAGGPKGLDKLAAAMEAAGVDSGDMASILIAGTQQMDIMGQAAKTAAAMNDVFGESHESVAKAAEKSRDAADKLNEAIQGVIDTTSDAVESAWDAEEAWDSWVASLDALATAVDDPTTLVNELAAAERDAEQAAYGMAQAAEENAKKQAALAGETLSARDAAQEHLKALEFMAGGLDPSSDLYKALQGYIDLQKQVIRDITSTYSATYTDPRISGNVPGRMRAFASGTPSAPAGVALVGEQGPELVNFRGGESVTPAGQTAALLGGGSPTYNITVNALKADADIGRIVVDAINAHTRNGGQGPR